MYTHDVIQIVDLYKPLYRGHRPADLEGEAQNLSTLIRPLGRNARKIAIVAKDDYKQMHAYRQAGYEIHPMNGERPKELIKFIRRMVADIKQSPPKHMVLVSDDPEFVHLCDEAAIITDLAVWASEATVPRELTHAGYNYQPLEEMLPSLQNKPEAGHDLPLQHNDTRSIFRVVEHSRSTRISSRPLRVFLCHSFNDKATVRTLYQHLYKDGVEPWLDEENLLPGQDWDREIRIAVRDSDAVIVCLSKGSTTKRGYVQKEIQLALDVAGEQPEGTIYIIPVKLEECDIPERLSRLHWIKLFEDGGYGRLIRALNRRAGSLGIKKGP